MNPMLEPIRQPLYDTVYYPVSTGGIRSFAERLRFFGKCMGQDGDDHSTNMLIAGALPMPRQMEIDGILIHLPSTHADSQKLYEALVASWKCRLFIGEKSYFEVPAEAVVSLSEVEEPALNLAVSLAFLRGGTNEEVCIHLPSQQHFRLELFNADRSKVFTTKSRIPIRAYLTGTQYREAR